MCNYAFRQFLWQLLVALTCWQITATFDRGMVPTSYVEWFLWSRNETLLVPLVVRTQPLLDIRGALQAREFMNAWTRRGFALRQAKHLMMRHMFQRNFEHRDELFDTGLFKAVILSKVWVHSVIFFFLFFPYTFFFAFFFSLTCLW